MKLTYIFHSGFLLETEKCMVIFDYWIDPCDVVKDALTKNKPTYVLASHHHEDHFCREIYLWKEQRADLKFFLSSDILESGRAKKHEADRWFKVGDIYEDDNLKIHAMPSNDCGVSWIIETEGKTIFHAGDLNNWYSKFLIPKYRGRKIWSYEMNMEIDPVEEENIFLQDLDEIAKVTKRFDLAMFPVDGRIGNGYTLGGRQFIEHFQVDMFVPMHFVLSGYESAWRMKEFTDPQKVPFWEISYFGESIDF